MSKIWLQAFLPDRTSPLPTHPKPDELRILYVPVILLTSVTVLVTLFANGVYTVAAQAADQLMNPQLYIQAVFGNE